MVRKRTKPVELRENTRVAFEGVVHLVGYPPMYSPLVSLMQCGEVFDVRDACEGLTSRQVTCLWCVCGNER